MSSTEIHNEAFTDNLVSVIMPMHNSAPFLSEAIESVLAQTYRKWELFIIDDGSKDNSVEIASMYAQKDPRISLLFNETPMGMPSVTRNVGIKAAHGRYIAFLDSDDLWFPDKLEQQLPLFSDKRVAIVYGDYEKMDQQGHRNSRFVTAPRLATYKSLLKSNVIANLTGIYDRKKVGTVLMKQLHHEDYVMWLSILKQGFVANSTGTVLGAYRVRDTSISSRKLETAKWQWTVYRKEEKLSLAQSLYNFVFYAFKAYAKKRI